MSVLELVNSERFLIVANQIAVWLFVAAWAVFSYPAAVTITGDRAANLV
jgi:hypothetical protein